MKKPFGTDEIDIQRLNNSFTYTNPASKYFHCLKVSKQEDYDFKRIYIWYHVEIEFCNLTEEQKHSFNGILPLSVSFSFDASNKKSFYLETDFNVKLFVAVICGLEPTLTLYKSFKNIGITVPSDVVNVTEMANTDKTFEDLIDLVLQASKIWPEKIAELSNFYQEGNKPVEYMKTLEAVPINNPFFKEANCQLLNIYNTLDDNSVPLSKKFKAAYNAQLPEAGLYFSELAGEKGISTLLLMQFGSDADFIISLALVINNKNQKIAALLPDEKISQPTHSFF